MTYARKHVLQELEGPAPLLVPGKDFIGLNFNSHGSSIFELQTSHSKSDNIFAYLPARFHKMIWFRKGSYCIYTIGDIPEDLPNEEVMAMIKHILTTAQIKQMVRDGLWPEEFKAETPIEPELIPASPMGDVGEEGVEEDAEGEADCEEMDPEFLAELPDLPLNPKDAVMCEESESSSSYY
eukprot:gnl/Dysnectes_brevis/2461_a2939_1621.p1 GENE.gnl/Dysnectes_brevis/2461_a2939_1621~~gnl/Dysnectes_brevis/2461_a2939_1621.p1  ORF type:complete len:181 (-),score=48.26 gnl/Dysnectes_brevis/2461_a2939_1621:81-623(-)